MFNCWQGEDNTCREKGMMRYTFLIPLWLYTARDLIAIAAQCPLATFYYHFISCFPAQKNDDWEWEGSIRYLIRAYAIAEYEDFVG